MPLSQKNLHQIRAFNRDYTELLGILNKRVFNTELSWPEARILMLIAVETPISPKDVAAKLALDRSYTSRIIKRLTAARLVVKTASPTDSRAIILSLTAAGKTLNQQLDDLSDAQLRTIFEPLSADNQQHAYEAIETLNQLLFK